MAAKTARHDRILQEAKTVTKWNKRRFNKQARKATQYQQLKSGYKKNGYDTRIHTMA